MTGRRPNTECAHCGKPIYRKPRQIREAKTGLCCSHSCSMKLRGSEHLRTPEVLAKRAATQRGENNPCWRGGRYVEPEKGYVMVRQPDHPRARANGYVLEHILVAEAMLGRPLAEGEEVHHLNGDRADNRPENLEVHSSHSEHWALHLPIRPKRQHGVCACGRPETTAGRCERCYAYWRRTGQERPPVAGRLPQPPRPREPKGQCACGLPATRTGRCDRCYSWFRRNGTERPPVAEKLSRWTAAEL